MFLLGYFYLISSLHHVKADLLAQYGGVAPKMAEEAHLQVIDRVVQEAFDKANLTERDLSAVAVTIGPGLSLCLRVGVRKARKIAGTFSLPITGVHHKEAHALVASVLILARDLGHYVQLGTTIDDAIGEAYDKIAKWLGLDLRRSGGPAIEELAREGDAKSIKFSTPMKQHKDCNFSYAGLMTQVRLAINLKILMLQFLFLQQLAKIEGLKLILLPLFRLLVYICVFLLVSLIKCLPCSGSDFIYSITSVTLRLSLVQRVAVLHLEERCERAIEWALKIEPSVKHMVCKLRFFILYAPT
ncbi:putative N(6)-L-threonylcarbamoyladenine synthase [Rosa chinensis]|uniref:N(6)-L-threonylcarbamoyladenine synthase n=1 Tax=Rosa chinensis TaxID=74649 RepID=A0A2P6SFX1_ROSCH|nr:putative N(6)-L-threonylcarbamoyladenine synthase [Rosa chinensis]